MKFDSCHICGGLYDLHVFGRGKYIHVKCFKKLKEERQNTPTDAITPKSLNNKIKSKYYEAEIKITASEHRQLVTEIEDEARAKFVETVGGNDYAVSEVKNRKIAKYKPISAGVGNAGISTFQSDDEMSFKNDWWKFLVLFTIMGLVIWGFMSCWNAETGQADTQPPQYDPFPKVGDTAKDNYNLSPKDLQAIHDAMVADGYIK